MDNISSDYKDVCRTVLGFTQNTWTGSRWLAVQCDIKRGAGINHPLPRSGIGWNSPVISPYIAPSQWNSARTMFGLLIRWTRYRVSNPGRVTLPSLFLSVETVSWNFCNGSCSQDLKLNTTSMQRRVSECTHIYFHNPMHNYGAMLD